MLWTAHLHKGYFRVREKMPRNRDRKKSICDRTGLYHVGLSMLLAARSSSASSPAGTGGQVRKRYTYTLHLISRHTLETFSWWGECRSGREEWREEGRSSTRRKNLKDRGTGGGEMRRKRERECEKNGSFCAREKKVHEKERK